MLKILIVDDDPIVRVVLKRALQSQGYDATVASNGEEGIIQAKRVRPALIICDWVMPQLDGLEVCRRLKSEPELATTFFILLSARGIEVEDRVRGLDAGADEFLSKPLEMNELKARVRAGLRLYQLNQDLQAHSSALEALNQKLQNQKQILEAELSEAVSYVRSLLPSPLVGTVTTEALFVPSAQLGGDCFDYYWLDHDNLAIYLLDVSGHGVGSALLSISVLNVLRTQSLPNTDFYQPQKVLKALNHAFQMVDHGEKYFTIWYGVYNQIKRQLIYASAGHPPAVLLSSPSMTSTLVKKLGFQSLPIGLLPEANFNEDLIEIKDSSSLYVFSDGAYEIQQPDGNILGLDAFIELLADCSRVDNRALEQVLFDITNLSDKETFEDDLSLLKVNFS